MRTIRFLLQKEFKQVFRNKAILMLIMLMPAVQLIILPLAANYEVKNINLAIIDHDHSTFSQQISNTIFASGYFRCVANETSYNHALSLVEADKADLLLEIPANFEKDTRRGEVQKLFVAVNAINGAKANIGAAYLQQISLQLINGLSKPGGGQPLLNNHPVIEIVYSNWFNPGLNYRLFMVPGILAVLVTMIGGFLSALNIVKEKEAGTIEQINVTPVKKYQFIIGKLVPFWILGNVVFTIGLLLGRFVYGIIPSGSIVLLYAFTAVYLLAILGFGLLISTFCDTQQQAMFVMFFFMIIFILLGGLFTSIESMPIWAQEVTRLNPVRYFVAVMRMIVLKGSRLRDVYPDFMVMAIFAIVFNVWAVINYKKTS